MFLFIIVNFFSIIPVCGYRKLLIASEANPNARSADRWRWKYFCSAEFAPSTWLINLEANMRLVVRLNECVTNLVYIEIIYKYSLKFMRAFAKVINYDMRWQRHLSPNSSKLPRISHQFLIADSVNWYFFLNAIVSTKFSIL